MRLAATVLLSTLLCAAPLARATTFIVDHSGGGDFTTIAAAVSVAATGDVILIAPGTYQGASNTNIDLAGKNLTIRSQSGAAVTTIDCERLGPNTRAFYMHSGEDTTCVIENLTILRGYAISGAAIWCDGASPKIVGCRFDSCGVAYGTVRLDNSSAKVLDCEFTDCSVFVTGGGMFVANSSPTVRGTTIERCTSGFHGGGYFHYEGGTSTLTDVLISDCACGGDGAGAFFQDAPSYLTGVEFVGNVADSMRGGGVYTNTDAFLTDCTFTGNYAGQEGGGIYCYGSFLDMNDCTFERNDGSAGGGVYGEDALVDMDGGSFSENLAGMGGGACVQGGLPSFVNVAFEADTAAIFGGGLASLDAVTEIKECSFTGNVAWLGAAVYCDGPSGPIINRCTLSGNHPDVGGTALQIEGCDPSVTNTIVAFTSGGEGMGCDFGANPTTTHSCFYSNDLGDGLCGSHSDNLFVDPLFCNGPVADVGHHDDSPCLPAGNGWSEQIGSEGSGGCGPSTGVDELPALLSLRPATPNPSSGASLIRWSAPAETPVEVLVYDPAGRLVRRTAAATAPDGLGSFLWDGLDGSGHRAASGTYYVRVLGAGEEARGKLLLVR